MATVQILAALTYRDSEDVFCALTIELGLEMPDSAPLRSHVRAQRHAADALVAVCRSVIGKAGA